MGRLIRNLSLGIIGVGMLAAAVAMFAEPFFAELYASLGIDTSLWVAPVLTFFQNHFVHLAIAVMFGFGVGVWGHFFATRLDQRGVENDDRIANTGTATRSVLRLQFTGKLEPPLSLFEENIQSWFAYWSPSAECKDNLGNIIFQVPASWAIFVIFEKEVEYRQTSAIFSGGEPASWQPYQVLPKSVIVSISGGVTKCDLEIVTRS